MSVKTEKSVTKKVSIYIKREVLLSLIIQKYLEHNSEFNLFMNLASLKISEENEKKYIIIEFTKEEFETNHYVYDSQWEKVENDCCFKEMSIKKLEEVKIKECNVIKINIEDLLETIEQKFPGAIPNELPLKDMSIFLSDVRDLVIEFSTKHVETS